MFRGLTVAAVVPAYNEAEFIKGTVRSMPGILDWIVVIDDHSSDGTLERLQAISEERVRVLRHKTNRGVGAAIVTGYEQAIVLGVDIAVVMAGDGQMDPDDLPSLLVPITNDTADYVKGNRFAHPKVSSEMPRVRYWGNRVLSLMTRATSGYSEIMDSQCGYTAIRCSTLRKLELSAVYRRYGYPNDLLAHLHSIGARVAQVTVRPVYDGQHSGIQPIRAIVPLSFVLTRSWIRRMAREVAPGTSSERTPQR